MPLKGVQRGHRVETLFFVSEPTDLRRHAAGLMLHGIVARVRRVG